MCLFTFKDCEKIDISLGNFFYFGLILVFEMVMLGHK
jgi:hypothetical protein